MPEDEKGTIYISNNFSHIVDHYSSHDFFVLTYYKTNDDYDPDDEYNKDKYWAFGSNTERLAPRLMCPIIETKFPENPSFPYVSNINLEIVGIQFFFIKDSGYLYGPVQAHTTDDRTTVKASDTQLGKLPLHHIWKIPESEVGQAQISTFDLDTKFGSYISSLGELGLVMEKESFDYGDDKKIINWANKTIFSVIDEKFSKKELQGLRDKIEKSKNYKIESTNRVTRLWELFFSHSDFSKERNLEIGNFLDSEKGLPTIQAYIHENEKKYIDFAKKEFEKEINDSITKLSLSKSTLESELSDSRVEKEKIRLEIEEYASELTQKTKDLKDNVEKQLADKKDKLIEVESEIKIKYEDLSQLKMFENVFGAVEHYKKQHQLLEYQVDKLKEEKDKHLGSFVLEFEKHLSANKIIGSTGLNKGKNTEVESLNQNLGNPVVKDSLIEIFDHYEACFSKSKRDFSRDEFLNIIIAIHTNILTIFSGSPGSGKTSLAKLISGVTGTTTNSFLNISVGKGWVSDRDLLGYINPIDGNWVESQSGLSTFMKTINARMHSPLALVLLDEANLSPIEHYWSIFIGACDNASEDLNVSGDNLAFGLNEPYRFIATINNDHTTEMISPRLIDRSAVIDVNNKGILDAIDFDDIDSMLYETTDWFEFKLVSNYLNDIIEKEDEDSVVDFRDKLNNIIDVLKEKDDEFGISVVLSNRKLKKIQRHYHIAEQLNLDPIITFDEIVCMYILPHITGHGGPFRRRLEKLILELERKHCIKSKVKVIEIIEKGTAVGDFYSFF